MAALEHLTKEVPLLSAATHIGLKNLLEHSSSSREEDKPTGDSSEEEEST